MSERESLLPVPSLYEGKDQEGIVYGPKVKSWNGWPADVVDEMRRWNSTRELHFVYTSRVFECPDCRRYIDSRGVAACQLDRVFICDDCIVRRVREWIKG